MSWVATPFGDEIASRRAGERPTLSIRLNHRLRRLNERVERWSLRYPKIDLRAVSRTRPRDYPRSPAFDRERFEVLRCPVDVRLFRPDGPRWQEGPSRYLLSVGRIEDPRKNFASLVRAFAPVAAREPDLDLVIVGPMDRRDNVVADAARDARNPGRVHLVGVKGGAELAAIYRGAEAYVMASRQEGLGIVVAEAQASGLPVVVMRCGGSDELVDETRRVARRLAGRPGRRGGALADDADSCRQRAACARGWAPPLAAKPSASMRTTSSSPGWGRVPANLPRGDGSPATGAGNAGQAEAPPSENARLRSGSSSKLAALDGMRGLAACYVMLGHARWLLWEGYSEGYLASSRPLHDDRQAARWRWPRRFGGDTRR